MIIEFKVANFRSIREEQTLSFIASNYSDELPQNLIELDLPGMKGVRLVKAIALYGANASGKSNVLGALQFLAKFVSESATGLQPGMPTGTQPFKLDAEYLDQPTRFELMMVVKGVRVLYGLALTRERVTSEYLVAFPKGKPQVWFEREWSGQTYEWSKPNQYFKHDEALRDKVRENASFVSVAAQFGNAPATAIRQYLEVPFSVSEMDKSSHQSLATRFFFAHPTVGSLLEHHLAAADLGISGAKIDSGQKRDVIRSVVRNKYRQQTFEEIGEDEIDAGLTQLQKDDEFQQEIERIWRFFSSPSLLHRGKGGDVIPLNFDWEESSGTRRFLDLLAQIYAPQSQKSFFTYDEIETGLHPLLVMEVLRTFFQSLINPEAQLIFTTHNPLLLDQTLMRRDQIWFTEKDDEGATRLYPLTDYAPRKDESLVKGYLSGRYGGIPFIPAGLATPDDSAVKRASLAEVKQSAKKGKKPTMKKLAKKGA
jgi:uncharacterized protein